MTMRPTISFDSLGAELVRLVEGLRFQETGLEPADLACAEMGAALGAGAGDRTLSRVMGRALGVGVGAEVLESVLVHLLGYVGLTAVERAGDVLRDHLPGRAPDVALSVPATFDERVSAGRSLYGLFDAKRPEAQTRAFAALGPLYYEAALELSCVVLGNGMLDLRRRELAAVSALSSLGGAEPQLRFHVGIALREGLDVQTLVACLRLVQLYAGLPRANNAARIVAEIAAAAVAGRTPDQSR